MGGAFFSMTPPPNTAHKSSLNVEKICIETFGVISETFGVLRSVPTIKILNKGKSFRKNSVH